jgi:hypothetical protein
MRSSGEGANRFELFGRKVKGVVDGVMVDRETRREQERVEQGSVGLSS